MIPPNLLHCPSVSPPPLLLTMSQLLATAPSAICGGNEPILECNAGMPSWPAQPFDMRLVSCQTQHVCLPRLLCRHNGSRVRHRVIGVHYSGRLRH